MKKDGLYMLLAAIVAITIVGCKDGGSRYALDHQDKEAKQMLQGVWVNSEEGNPAIMVKGDSILFPDTSSLPAFFWIYKDSIYLQGQNISRYHITKQAEHVFRFENQSGEEVKLVKGSDGMMNKAFMQYRPYALNIFRTLDSDTTATVGGVTYVCRTHIEPTSDRLIATSFNNEGIEVENMYLDNDARLDVSVGQRRVYSHHFRKQEFSTLVPDGFMNKSILRDIQYNHADTGAVYFDAVIGVPDASSAYVVELKVTKEGKLAKRLR